MNRRIRNTNYWLDWGQIVFLFNKYTCMIHNTSILFFLQVYDKLLENFYILLGQIKTALLNWRDENTVVLSARPCSCPRLNICACPPKEESTEEPGQTECLLLFQFKSAVYWDSEITHHNSIFSRVKWAIYDPLPVWRSELPGFLLERLQDGENTNGRFV